MNITIQDLVSELKSFGTVPNTLENLDGVDIDTNNKSFRRLVFGWSQGRYDEDRYALISDLEYLVNNR